jgi:hypothetical protein
MEACGIIYIKSILMVNEAKQQFGSNVTPGMSEELQTQLTPEQLQEQFP